MPLLSVKNLNVEFEGRKIIQDFSFDIEKGETVAFIGPNGAGKTILFKALLSLIPYHGEIKWKENVKIGYVPQRLSIDRNFPLSAGDIFDFEKISRSKAKLLLHLMGAGLGPAGEEKYKDIFKERVGILSGGEFQRLLIAWAVAEEPDVLLFDEPTAGVDIGAEETIYQTLAKLQKIKGFTILLISHDVNVVYKYATKVICVNKKKICFGSPLDVLNAENLKRLYGEEAALYKHIHH